MASAIAWTSVGVTAASLSILWWSLHAWPPARSRLSEPTGAQISAGSPRAIGDAVVAADDPIGEPADGSALADAGDEPWTGVAVAEDAFGVIAVWTDSELFVSRDDGRTFQQILGGPGRIGAATVGARGAVYVVRDPDQLGVLAADGTTAWRSLPVRGQTLGLDWEGGVLAWLMVHDDDRLGLRGLLAVSRDDGQSWPSLQVMPELGTTRAALRVGPSGEIDIAMSNASHLDLALLRYRASTAATMIRSQPFPGNDPDRFGFGADGWMYAVDGERGICGIAVDAEDLARACVEPADWDLQVGTNGVNTFAIAGGELWRFEPPRLHRIATDVPAGPGDVGALAVDGMARPVALLGRHLLRRSDQHGWRVLLSHSHRTTP